MYAVFSNGEIRYIADTNSSLPNYNVYASVLLLVV